VADVPGGFCLCTAPEVNAMNEHDLTNQIAKRRIVYSIPGMDRMRTERDLPYATRNGETLTMDLYYPSFDSPAVRPAAPRELAHDPPDEVHCAGRAAVLLVTGYPDPGVARIFGCHTRHLGAFVSWAQLLAASGVVAITYANREPADGQAAFDHVRLNAARLGIDADRLGIWSCSGHGPNALSLLINEGRHIRCACLISAYTLDREGSTQVADASARFRFVTAGRSVNEIPRDAPMFVARAGRDEMPGLNDALDAFVCDALARNLPLTAVNHAAGPHAFDVFDESEASREVIRAAVRFLRFHLGVVEAPMPGV
jgi:hypothetical protein